MTVKDTRVIKGEAFKDILVGECFLACDGTGFFDATYIKVSDTQGFDVSSNELVEFRDSTIVTPRAAEIHLL